MNAALKQFLFVVVELDDDMTETLDVVVDFVADAQDFELALRDLENVAGFDNVGEFVAAVQNREIAKFTRLVNLETSPPMPTIFVV